MSEIEKSEKSGGEDNSTAAYTTVAVGVALLVAAVLVVMAAGTPAAGIGFVIGAAACLGWGIPQIMKNRKSLPAPDSREKELLSAICESDGGSLVYSLPQRRNREIE